MEIFPATWSAQQPLSTPLMTSAQPTTVYGSLTAETSGSEVFPSREARRDSAGDPHLVFANSSVQRIREATPRHARMIAAGTPVDLCGTLHVLAVTQERLFGGKALAIGSVNLDHLHHFGGVERGRENLTPEHPEIDWLLLADGMPIVTKANELTGTSWPRLAGSDLLPELLELAEETGKSVGFLGGTPKVHDLLRLRLKQDYPLLRVSGFWAPDRVNVYDPDGSAEIAESIRSANTDIVVVSLGKPHQELWIDKFGSATDARIFLAFGAAPDFLAGLVGRAPTWMSNSGLEWMFRLLREPVRLSRRYLVQGPRAWLRLRGAYLAYDTDIRPNGGR